MNNKFVLAISLMLLLLTGCTGTQQEIAAPEQADPIPIAEPAKEPKDTEKTELPNEPAELFVVTRECPAERVEYVRDEIAGFVLCGEEGVIPSATVEVGTPFYFMNRETDMTDMVLFPILFDHRVKYVLRVVGCRGWSSGTMSESYADELNALLNATTEDTPAAFFMEEQYLYVKINGESKAIFEYAPVETGSMIPAPAMFTEQPTRVVNIMEPLDIVVNFDEALLEE